MRIVASSGQTFGEVQSVGAFENNLAADNSLNRREPVSADRLPRRRASDRKPLAAMPMPLLPEEREPLCQLRAVPSTTTLPTLLRPEGLAPSSSMERRPRHRLYQSHYRRRNGQRRLRRRPGVPNAGDGQGLVINIVYDASVANAPTGFTQAVANVVAFYESHFRIR